MSSLLVSLPLAPATAATEWAYALTADGRTLAGHGTAPAALLPGARGAGAEVVAIVPVQALAWHRIDLPRGAAPGSPRLRAALEGLLEEQLLDDAEALHLALEPGAQAGQPAWVAVCDRAWLRQALQLLEGAGHPASRIVPEFAPEGAPALYALGDPRQTQLVVAGPDGVLALPLAAAVLPSLPALADDTPCHAEPGIAALAEQVLQRKLTLQQAPLRWLQSAQTRWDLGQFDLASSARARALRKLTSGWGEVLRGPAWRPARWAAVLLVAANLVGLNAWAWKERSDLDAKREAIRRALTQAFPQVKVIVDAPLQMEREVAALRQATGAPSARDLEAMLGAVAAALPGARAPAGIDFTPGDLRLRGLALPPDEARAVTTQLKALGYATATQGDALAVTLEAGR